MTMATGKGKSRKTLIRILFIVFLIPVIGIRGYLTGLLISQIALCVLALLWLYRLMKKGSSG